MTSDKITDLLVARLVRDHGRSKHHWRKVIGRVRLYSRDTHPHCNWSITPTGSAQEISVIETLMDDLRMRHPLLTASKIHPMRSVGRGGMRSMVEGQYATCPPPPPSAAAPLPISR